MDTQLLLRSTYLDVIFDGRNKAYGSYDLRITYPQRMKRAGLFIFSLCLFFAAYTMWANRTKPLTILPLPSTMDTLTFVNLELDIPKEKIPLPEPPSTTASVNTEKFTIPDIIENNAVRDADLLATKKELEKAVAGNITMQGDSIGNESFDNVDKNGNGKGGPSVIEHGGSGFENKIETVVEQDPEFPGGEKALYEYLSNHIQYPAAALSASKEGKVLMKFVVNEDGTVSRVEAARGFGYGSEDEGIRVVSTMPKWKPGRNNGRAVKVWFQVPIFFKLN